MEITRINNNSNGHPRYVAHYLDCLPENLNSFDFGGISEAYSLVIQHAKKHGGKRFSNKQYGGGIAFQVWNPSEVNEKVDLIKRELTELNK